MDTLTITVPIKPKACPRPRVASRGRFAHAYYPKTYTDWKKLFDELILKELESRDLPVSEPIFSGTVYLKIVNSVKKPKTTKRTFPPYDIDNYTKSVMDGITSCNAVWIDDDQVISLEADKVYGDTDYVEITIESMEK